MNKDDHHFADRLRDYQPEGDVEGDFADFQVMLNKGAGAAGAGSTIWGLSYELFWVTGLLVLLAGAAWWAGLVVDADANIAVHTDGFSAPMESKVDVAAQTIAEFGASVPDSPTFPGISPRPKLRGRSSGPTLPPVRLNGSGAVRDGRGRFTEGESGTRFPVVHGSSPLEADEPVPPLPPYDYYVLTQLSLPDLPTADTATTFSNSVRPIKQHSFGIGIGLAYAPANGIGFFELQGSPYLSVNYHCRWRTSRWQFGGEISLTRTGNSTFLPEIPYVRTSLSGSIAGTGNVLTIDIDVFDPYLLQLGPSVRYSLGSRVSFTGGVRYVRLFYRQATRYSSNIPVDDPLRQRTRSCYAGTTSPLTSAWRPASGGGFPWK